jgi:hypothetical protein
MQGGKHNACVKRIRQEATDFKAISCQATVEMNALIDWCKSREEWINRFSNLISLSSKTLF